MFEVGLLSQSKLMEMVSLNQTIDKLSRKRRRCLEVHNPRKKIVFNKVLFLYHISKTIWYVPIVNIVNRLKLSFSIGS